MIERMAELAVLVVEGFEPLLADDPTDRLAQPFRPVPMPDNRLLGEDLSVCRRWIEDCCGEVWACVKHEVTHVGTICRKGRFASRRDRTSM